MMWKIEDAIMVINKINSVCKKHGYFCCLYGSVLYNGKSNKDLDLQLISYLGVDYSEYLLRDVLLIVEGESVAGEYMGILNTKSYVITLKDGRIVDLVIRMDKPLMAL